LLRPARLRRCRRTSAGLLHIWLLHALPLNIWLLNAWLLNTRLRTAWCGRAR
jgi:hypothetical protein